MTEEFHNFLEPTRTADVLAKAEGWLSSLADYIEMAPAQEAVVYLRSRGHDCHGRVTTGVESWKRASN
jgi:hypothetical protein